MDCVFKAIHSWVTTLFPSYVSFKTGIIWLLKWMSFFKINYELVTNRSLRNYILCYSKLQVLLGAGTVFFIFGGIAVLSLLFIFFIIPETKGLTLEEIEAKYL